MAALLLTLLMLVTPGGWQWPVGSAETPPAVVAPFDPPAVEWGSGHRGVDLAAAAGTPVRAAGDGVVAFAGQVAGRGVVSVQHPGGLRTTYEPVRPLVAAGMVVRSGDSLGTLTAAGHCSRPCLHWGLRSGSTYLDPLSLVQPTRVRLWPWSGSGMGLPVRLPQSVDGHMGVALGGGHRGVAQQLLHASQVGPALEQVGGGRVPQPVGPDVWRVRLPPDGLMHDAPYDAWVDAGAAQPQEQRWP
jgi:murein DD-endopeptidase MepM/ murein hydrolase activator NlpD